MKTVKKGPDHREYRPSWVVSFEVVFGEEFSSLWNGQAVQRGEF